MIATRSNQALFDLNTQNKLAFFNMARMMLMTAVLFTTIFLRQEVLGEFAILQIYSALAASFLLSLVHVSFWEQTLKVRYFMPSQLLYDLLLTSYLVYLTGVNDSIFLFLYLLNIVFSSVVFQLNGALTVAGLSGAVYAFIYAANVDFDQVSAWYNLAYNELLFLLTALLCGQFMDELKKQKIMLESQQESIARLELLNDRLLNSIPVGIVLVDSTDYVLKVNQTAIALLRLSRAPEMKLKYYELLPDLKGIFSAWEKMSEMQRLKFLFKHGNEKPHFALQLVKLKEESQGEEDTKHIIVFEDVSKMLELEHKLEFESKLAATGQLAAGIAHEIRNPLASISGSIEMLSQHLHIENEQDKKLLQISLREVSRLNTLITDFLEFAKPKDHTREEFLLSYAVQEVAEAVQTRSADRKIVVNIDVPLDLGISANQERIKQVFFNLFLNSIESSASGPITINVAAIALAHDQVLISVIDNGPGISSEIASKIFDPFFTTKQNGTGLGLSTVAQIIKTFKGEIHLIPSMTGAHFEIILPAANVAAMNKTGT